MAEDLTVLIANLGQIDQLRSCLASIFATLNGKTSVRVIVGFNFEGESDNPRRLAEEFPQVETLRAPVKLGYCRAYNLLMAAATGRYILLLDDDTVLRRGTIDDMVAFMDAHPDVGIAGCRTVNADGSYQKTTALMNSLRTEFINVWRPASFWNDGIDQTLTGWTTVEWLNGHYMMCRADVIRQVGGLDEHYYTIQCEADWCLRIRQAGWIVAYVPDTEIMHVGGAQSIVSKVKTFDNIFRSLINRYYFMHKHYSWRDYALFRGVMCAGALMRMVKYAVVWLCVRHRRAEAAPKVRAYGAVALLAFARHPESLPDRLKRYNVKAAGASFHRQLPASHPEQAAAR